MKQNQYLPRTHERARAVHEWVTEFARTHHYDPSYAEVAAAFGLSLSHVSHLRRVMVNMNLMHPVPPGIERAWPLRRMRDG